MPKAATPLDLVIVDDEPQVTAALTREIGLRYPAGSVTLCPFNDPRSALAYVQDKGDQVFMVISDLRMPGLSGAELLEAIRRHNPLVQTTLLTAYSDMDDISRAVSASIRSLLLKPWNQDRLYAEIDAALNEFTLRRENVRLKAELEFQLDTAGDFQRRLLDLRSLPLVWPEIEVKYLPVQRYGCSGDYYDVFKLPDGRVVLLLGDVAGHGIRSALITMMIKTLALGYRLGDQAVFASPSALLERLNRDLHHILAGATNCWTAFAAVIVNRTDKEISISNAGLPAAILRRQHGELVTLAKDGLVLAFADDSRYRETTLPIAAGDSLFLSSDGLTENKATGQTLEVEAANRLVGECLASGGDAQLLLDRFRELQPGQAFTDDVSVLIARF
ncbi:MAG: hypothetical protein A2087_02075 [Spirochaetes bacterium GWD1_61_31]|nr:MAG: hypothetical protein A2Y37_11805 [Spirochaetes bacterium GWB1_60_80]OHD29951.1 MAG: hypothetical protein A2004_12045 [Spirochaetes bacterium GWC1_61_12]OHD43809.1 MAG: hypothetical protein A2087_02075 [Spirochaetes bacterium GWD1_61_31]OHD46051.1 MAG: hypothetical protein A2Y35_13630 [Spirochaetes bacterium GWE1_60_18]OHD60623.1 MAG: hypothetical protein A2Y32_08120 [Spirochaetes bacterium GWF1_60_12]HAP43462.1 hypothetical protein [Spirochaetaceae bacterium]